MCKIVLVAALFAGACAPTSRVVARGSMSAANDTCCITGTTEYVIGARPSLPRHAQASFTLNNRTFYLSRTSDVKMVLWNNEGWSIPFKYHVLPGLFRPLGLQSVLVDATAALIDQSSTLSLDPDTRTLVVAAKSGIPMPIRATTVDGDVLTGTFAYHCHSH